jgi:hypothetical protein
MNLFLKGFWRPEALLYYFLPDEALYFRLPANILRPETIIAGEGTSVRDPGGKIPVPTSSKLERRDPSKLPKSTARPPREEKVCHLDCFLLSSKHFNQDGWTVQAAPPSKFGLYCTSALPA